MEDGTNGGEISDDGRWEEERRKEKSVMMADGKNGEISDDGRWNKW
jgi:hypothetical protein